MVFPLESTMRYLMWFYSLHNATYTHMLTEGKKRISTNVLHRGV